MSPTTARALLLCVLSAASAGCPSREKSLTECMDNRVAASEAWSRYNTTLRQASERAALTGGRLDLPPADPPDNPFQMTVYARQVEGTAGVATVELGAAKTATNTMWQSCRLLCEDMGCSGIVVRGGSDERE